MLIKKSILDLTLKRRCLAIIPGASTKLTLPRTFGSHRVPCVEKFSLEVPSFLSACEGEEHSILKKKPTGEKESAADGVTLGYLFIFK